MYFPARIAIVSAGLLLTGTAQALEFSVQSIPVGIDQKIAFMPYVSEASNVPGLLVVETPDINEREKQALGTIGEPARTFSLFRYANDTWELYLHRELDAGMDLVDTVRGSNGINLAGYQRSQVLVLQEETRQFEPLLTARSMYVGSNWDSSPTFDMFVDLNNDGWDDFLMPDFEGWQVAMQREDGFAETESVGPGPQMNFGETAQFVGYRAETPHVLDQNMDGLNDLAFWMNGRFEVYLQDPSGSFASEPVLLDAGLNDVLGGFFSVSFEDEEDQESKPQRMLDAVDDINADGYSDLIIQTMMGEGIFGLETRYEIHRGRSGPDGQLAFEAAASSIVSSDGIQMDNERLDLTGDGKQEFVVTSVNITLGAIIAALITRSASVDVAVYRMTDDLFPDEPSLEKRIKVRFDFSGGDLFVPAVLSAEVTGDSRKDLLVQKDEDTLLVYPGEATSRLFAKTPIRLELPLPKDREAFLVSDLDRDGRDELVLHVKRDDSSVLSVVTFAN